MSDRDQVLMHLAGMLTPEEEKKFTAELEKSESLRLEYNRLKRGSEHLSSLQSNIEVNSQYFSTVIPRFRDKLEKKKTKTFSFYFRPALVFSISTFIVLSVFFSTNLYHPAVVASATDFTDLKVKIETMEDIAPVVSTVEANVIDDKFVKKNASVINSSIDEELNKQLGLDKEIERIENKKYDKKVEDFVTNLTEDEIDALVVKVTDDTNL